MIIAIGNIRQVKSGCKRWPLVLLNNTCCGCGRQLFILPSVFTPIISFFFFFFSSLILFTLKVFQWDPLEVDLWCQTTSQERTTTYLFCRNFLHNTSVGGEVHSSSMFFVRNFVTRRREIQQPQGFFLRQQKNDCHLNTN